MVFVKLVNHGLDCGVKDIFRRNFLGSFSTDGGFSRGRDVILVSGSYFCVGRNN